MNRTAQVTARDVAELLALPDVEHLGVMPGPGFVVLRFQQSRLTPVIEVKVPTDTAISFGTSMIVAGATGATLRSMAESMRPGLVKP